MGHRMGTRIGVDGSVTGFFSALPTYLYVSIHDTFISASSVRRAHLVHCSREKMRFFNRALEYGSGYKGRYFRQNKSSLFSEMRCKSSRDRLTLLASLHVQLSTCSCRWKVSCRAEKFSMQERIIFGLGGLYDEIWGDPEQWVLPPTGCSQLVSLTLETILPRVVGEVSVRTQTHIPGKLEAYFSSTIAPTK